jgi:hypothetical protein
MAWRRPQSHFRQLRQTADTYASGGDAAQAGMAGAGTAAWYARRARLRAAVFDTRGDEPWTPPSAAVRSVATGVLAEVREDAIVLDTGHGPEFFALCPGTVTWAGAPTAPAALRPGDHVIVRHRAPEAGMTGAGTTGAGTADRRIAERVWARIGRIAGVIVAADGPEFLVDAGRKDGAPRRVVLATASARRVQVRFPRLEPGYLLDVIGTREGDHLLAVAPATAQPPYRAGHSPPAPLVTGPVPVPISGSAVWHEPDDEPPGLLGLGYPALDPESGRQPAGGTGCIRLPYLSLGSAVRIGNECAGRSTVLPVTSDGAMARLFCDRCVHCGTSPKGRVADLTMAAFAELGGNLEDGCFNATMTTNL